MTERLTEGKLLEGAVVGLGVEEGDDAELKSDPATVDGKVLPADGFDGDGVDVVGEETSELSENLLNTDTTRTGGVGPELDEVGVGKGVVTNVVAGGVAKVEEESCNVGRSAGDLVLLVVKLALEGNGVADEAQKHERGGQLVHPATREAGDNEGEDSGVSETPAGVGDIDTGLGVALGVSHKGVQLVRIVADKGVSGQLSEEAEEDGDEESAAHTSSAEEIEPALLSGLELEVNDLADLDDLSLNHGVGRIALSVVLD